MTRGRKPKPKALKKLHGTSRPDRARNEPVPPSGDLEPTPQIDCCKFGREIWNHYVATAPIGMLKPVDVPLLERLCIALSMAREAQEHVQKFGMVIAVGQKTDETGKVIVAGTPAQSPYLSIVNRQSELARKLASELGLPVTARARLDMPEYPTQPGAQRTGAIAARGQPESFNGFLASNPQEATRH